MATVNFYWGASTTNTVVVTSSNLSGLTTGSLAISTATYNNSTGYQYAYAELLMESTGALASGDFVQGWFLVSANGTNFEDSTGLSITPARAADVIWPLRAVTNSTQRVIVKNTVLPASPFYTLVQNMSSTSFDTGINKITITPYNEEAI